VKHELIRRAYALADDPREDVPDEELAEVYAPDVVIDMSVRVFNPKAYRGYDGLREYRIDLRETWDEVVFDVVEFIEEGESVLVMTRMRGRGRAGRVPIDERGAGIWTFRDDRAVHHLFLGPISRDDALAALRAQS
jgi:ketosteroid isomerase-like protein